MHEAVWFLTCSAISLQITFRTRTKASVSLIVQLQATHRDLFAMMGVVPVPQAAVFAFRPLGSLHVTVWFLTCSAISLQITFRTHTKTSVSLVVQLQATHRDLFAMMGVVPVPQAAVFAFRPLGSLHVTVWFLTCSAISLQITFRTHTKTSVSLVVQLQATHRDLFAMMGVVPVPQAAVFAFRPLGSLHGAVWFLTCSAISLQITFRTHTKTSVSLVVQLQATHRDLFAMMGVVPVPQAAVFAFWPLGSLHGAVWFLTCSAISLQITFRTHTKTSVSLVVQLQATHRDLFAMMGVVPVPQASF